MANTLRFKRGLASGLPTGLAGEPLFTTDTFDLYIGNGTTNTRFQKYIASGATTQILRGDGSLYTFPLAINSPSAGQVLKYNGTSWVNDSDAGITGSGTTNYLPKFTSATTLGNSVAVDTGAGIDVTRAGDVVLGVTATAAGSTSIYLTPNGGGFGQLTTLGSTHLRLGTNGTERARIFATGNFGINTGATDSGQRLQVVGTGYFSDSVGIGSTSLSVFNLRISKNLTGGVNTYAVYQDGVVQSGSTTSANGFMNVLQTQAATFNISNYRHFFAAQGTIGAGSTITNQYAFWVDDLTTATNNYGFAGGVLSGTGKWNLYMYGTAKNYLAGELLVNTLTSVAGYQIAVGGAIYASSNIRFDTAIRDNRDNAIVSQSLSSVITNRVLTIGNATYLNINFPNGNTLIGSTYDTGEKLQVTGTMKVTGASSFGDNLTISKNHNGATSLIISNTTNGSGAESRIVFNNNSGGSASVGKLSSSYTTYKILAGNDSYLYNYLNGDIAIHNDVSTGNIKFAAGGSSTAQMTLASTGALTVVGATTIGLTSTTGYSLVVQNSGANDTSGIRLTSGGTDNGYFITAYNSVSKYASLQAGDNTAYRNIVLNLLGGNVGIGISPTYKLHVSGTGYFSDNVRFPNLKGIVFVQTGGSLLGSISMDSSDQVTIDNNGFFGLSVGTSYNLLGGNTGIGTSSFGTSATRTFAMLNGTAPSTSPTDIFQMYSNDITAGNAAPHFRTENGAVVKIYQQTSAVGTASWVGGAGSTVTDLDTFDGYTIGQIVKALRNAGFLQ